MKIIFVLILSTSLLQLSFASGTDELTDPARAYGGKYIFSLNALNDIRKSVSQMDTSTESGANAMLKVVHQKIYEQYPNIVTAPGKEHWAFNAVGGELAQMTILYCSPTEVLGLWGAHRNIYGFSGRYPKMHQMDFMLSGQMETWTANPHDGVKVYQNKDGVSGVSPISNIYPGEGFGITIPEQGMYEITYSRGSLASTLHVGGIMGHQYVTGDKVSRNALLLGCAKRAIRGIFSKQQRRAIKCYKNNNPDYTTGDQESCRN